MDNTLIDKIKKLNGGSFHSAFIKVRASNIHFEVLYISIISQLNKKVEYKWDSDLIIELNKFINLLKPHLVSDFFNITTDNIYYLNF